MEFPVDLLATVDPEALEQAAKDYMSKLLYRNPEIRESLSLPDSSEVEIGLCNVGFVPLYGCDIKQKILALFSPEDRFKAVGLYLLGQWWAAEDILKTADPSRTGLLEVRTPGERIVLYVLNRIIYRTQEKASDDIHFLCHEEHEIAKILWKDGEAIGFYSVKPEGTLCRSFLTQCYQLPIMDTIYIRKCHRRNGYGLQMLKDFVRSFKTDCLGLKYPLSPAMYKVCKNYLSTYPADKELLWEVDGIGGLFQRTLIARKLQAMELKGDHQVVSRLNFETEHTDVQMEEVRTQVQKTMEYTVEEEVVQIKITKEVQDTPVSTRVRSSNLKRKKLGEETGDTAEKIIRVEDIEAGVQSPVEELMPSVVSSSLNVTEANLKEATVTVTHSEEHVLDVTQVHDKEHKEMTVESEECALEVCALTQPTSEPATVTPEEALETTEVFQMTPSAEIQSLKSHKETQVVKSFETTIGLVDLQPLELQQAVEVEVVKMTSGTEEVKEITEEVTRTKDEVEKTVVAAASVVEEAKSSCEEIACLEKPCHQTELDPKPVSMFSEESTTTEIRVLRKSSCRVSTATPTQKSTRLYEELQVASHEDKASPQQKSIQRSKAAHQEDRIEVVEQSENEEDQEMGKEKEKEDVMGIGRDANEACSIQNKDTEETDVTNEEVVTEEHQVGPLDVVLEGEDIKTDVERTIAEENREETGHSVVELAEIQDSEPSEELLDPKTPLDVAGATNEDRETESVEKEKAEIKQIALSENVVGGAEEKNENLETEKDTVDEHEAGVPGLLMTQAEHMDDEEPMKDTQESISEKEKVPEVQAPSLDNNEVILENRTELTEEEDLDKTSTSCSTGKHDGQRSDNTTPIRDSQTFKDETPEGELTRRVLRSGTKPFTAVSKQRHARHIKTVKQQGESEPPVHVTETHTGDTEGEIMETVRITSVEDDENVKHDDEERSSLEMEHLEAEKSDDHDLKEVEFRKEDSQSKNKVDEDQVRTEDLFSEVTKTAGKTVEIAVIDFDDAEVTKDAEAKGKETLQSVGEPVEEQEEGPDMVQEKEVVQTESLVEKEQTESEQVVDNSSSTEKQADVRRSNYATPLRRSGRFKDQPLEGELTERVLRSGTKSVVSTQKHTRHTKTVKQKYESAQAVVEPEAEQKEACVESHTAEAEEKMNTVIISSVEGESKIGKEHLKIQTNDDHENQMADGSQNEPTGDGRNIAVMDIDDAVMKDAETQAEGKTTVQSVAEPAEEQEDEQALEMTQKKDGQNVVESTSGFILLKAITDENEEESKEQTEVEKRTESLVKPAEKEPAAVSETSIGTSESQEDRLNKADSAEKENAYTEIGVEESMTSSLHKQVGEMGPDKTDNEQDQNMLADEKLKDDGVGEMVEEEESTAAVTRNTAEEKSEKHQKEDQEGVTSGHEGTVQESSTEEETPVIVSRSLRQRTVTVMSPLQRKPKRLQKTEGEMPGREHEVMVEVTDSLHKSSIEEPEENKDEKMETDDGAESNKAVKAPKSTDVDQCRMEVVQGEETLKETNTPQEVPGNEEMEIREVSKVRPGDEGDKSGNWTATFVEEEASDRADRSRGKDADSRPYYATPLRRSGRFKDQSLEGEVTKMVLRSGTKPARAISKQKHIRHKRREESAQAVGESEQKEVLMQSHSGDAEEETGFTSTEDSRHLKDSTEDESGMEKKHLQTETDDDHDLKKVENKTEDGSQNETTEDGKKVTVVNIDDAERETEVKTTHGSVGEPTEKQVEDPGIEMAQKEDGQEVVESISLENVAVVLVDFNKVPPKQTHDTETTEETSQNLEEADQEPDKPPSTEEEKNKEEDEEVRERESLDESAEKEKTQEEDWANKADALPEMGAENPLTEDQVVEVGVDKMLKTGTEQEESMFIDEKLKDDRAGEITLIEETSAEVAAYTAEGRTSESEKQQKEVQESVTPGHEETVQESSLEEETPVISSRSLRKRTITVISTPQRKPKHLQVTEVKISEHEKIIEKPDKSRTEETEENKDEKIKTKDSAVSSDDGIPEIVVIDQSQMEVLQEVEHVKETSTPQKIPSNEESAGKELSESSLPGSDCAEVVKDAETEDEDEGKAQEQLSSESAEEQLEKSAIEIILGQAEQKPEESTKSLKLQKASVVLVDFSKVPTKQTAEKTLQPQEEACQELEEPADISKDTEKSKAEEEGMKLTQAQVESAEKEQVDEGAVKIAESENVVMDDAENKTAEGTSKIRDDNDEKMETEEESVKEDEGRVPKLMQGEEPVNETLPELPHETQTQEPAQANKEESHIQIEVEISDKAHKADRRKRVDNEKSEVGTPVRRSRQLADQPMASELTTRVLRSSTKQVRATPKQRDTRQTKGMMQKEESEQTVEKTGEKREEIKEIHADTAEGEKGEIVITEGTMKELITAVEGRDEENNELEAEITKDNEAVTDISTQQRSEEDKATADEVEEATGETTDQEIATEVRVGEKTLAQPATESVEEQVEAPVTEMAQNEDEDKAVESTSAFTIQKATVVLVDFNKVPPMQTGDSETTKETSQSQEVIDNQTTIDEEREESNKEIAEKEQTVKNKSTSVLAESEPLPEMEVEKPMTENLEEATVNMDADNSLNTGTKQEEIVLAKEKLKDDNNGDAILETESIVTVSEEMMVVSTYENQKEVEESVTPGHEETPQETLPEEETPVITSRSLRRRTVTVISTPQRKHKRVQKTEVEISQHEKVCMTETVEKIGKGSTEKKDEKKNKKMEAGNSALLHHEEAPESSIIDQSQIEVLQEAEHVKETSTPQENEKSAVKELSESSLADKTAVPDSDLAETVKDAHTDVESKKQSSSKSVEEQFEGSSIEIIPGQCEQKGEEAIASLKLQKASDVLVEVPPKQTTYHGIPEETSQPQEKAHQELEEPADISMESKAEDEGMKRTHTQTESAEKEQADINAVPTAESESVVMDDAQSKTAEGTSEIRDDQDEKMEAEEKGIPGLMQEKEPVHETTAVQESPGETQVQEPLQIGKEESHTQNEGEFSDTAHKADRREQVDNERSEVGTPVRHSRRLADQPMVSELTTRVLRSSTKQIKGTPNQRDTHLTKGMMQKEVAEGEKVETVTTEGAMKGLITTLEGRVEENIELEAEKIEDNQAVTDNRTQQSSEQEDEAAQIKGTMDEESISGRDVSDTMKASETGVEEKTPAQPVTEPVEEQVEAPVTEMAQNEDGDKAVESTSAFTIQKATVFNKVPPIQTGDSETPEETSQSQEVIDNQTSIDEEKEESNKEIEEQEPTVNVGADNSLNTGTEQEKTVLAEEKLKDDNVGDAALEGESTATVSKEMTAACTHKNQKEFQGGIASDQETAQESSPEDETPVITSRSLRRRTVTVISTPQKKYKHVQKPGLQADTEKAEADEDTDVNKAGKTPLTCLPVEASMPEREVEDTSGNGKAISEAEEQECILREQGVETLIVEERHKIELERLEKLVNEGAGVREESEAKGKEEIASNTAVAADVEATTREKGKISQVKSTEVDNVGEENMDRDMTLPVQEEEISTGSPENVLVEATSHKEGMEEGEVDSPGKENNCVTKPPHETTEKVVSEDEEETVITRSLRRRTITVKSPMRRKYKRQEVAEKPTDKPQSEKEAPSREDSTKLETAGPITAAEKKNEIKITETNLKDESEKATSEEVVCLDEQEGTNTAEPDGEKVDKITGGEKDTVEGVPEDKLEERTTEDANNEKVVEVRDFMDNALEEDPDKDEEGSANPEQGDDQQEHVLDKVKEQLLLEQSEEVYRVVVEEETMSSPDKSPDEVKESVGVERRSLRKRTIAIKATTERKSKRMRKQGQDETPEQVHESTTEEPATEQADVMTLTEKETTHQAEQADDTEKDGEAVSEKTQELGEGETNESTEKEDATHELINVPVTNTNMEAREGEEEGENKAEADEYKGKAAEHENKNTDEGDTTVGTVGEIHENQEEAELMGKNGQEGSEISLILDESFTLELEEEEENNGPQENKVVDEIKASVMKCPKDASTTIRNTDNDEEESAVKGRQALRGRSQRQSKRFPTESQSEMEDRSEVEIEQEEKKKSQEKRKAIVDLTPRRSKRLARPKIV